FGEPPQLDRIIDACRVRGLPRHYALACVESGHARFDLGETRGARIDGLFILWLDLDGGFHCGSSLLVVSCGGLISRLRRSATANAISDRIAGVASPSIHPPMRDSIVWSKRKPRSTAAKLTPLKIGAGLPSRTARQAASKT